MKPLFVLAAEERLKGQPERHAKVFKDDISVFEADMIYVKNHLLRCGYQSLGQIAKATGIPKATVQKMLSPLGIKRIYDLVQLQRVKENNVKRYVKILSEHTGVIRSEDGKWRGLEFRESDRDRFREWLFAQGFLLVSEKGLGGEPKHYIVQVPEYLKEEIAALYTHRIMRGRGEAASP